MESPADGAKMSDCLFCKQPAQQERVDSAGDRTQFVCDNCGRYVADRPARHWLRSSNRDPKTLVDFAEKAKKTPDDKVLYIWTIRPSHLTRARWFDREQFWSDRGPPEGFDETAV